MSFGVYKSVLENNKEENIIMAIETHANAITIKDKWRKRKDGFRRILIWKKMK